MGRPAGWMYKLTGRGAMRSPGAPSHRRETERRFWEQIATGITSGKAAESVGVSQAVGTRWFRHNGGMPLSMLNPISGRYLSFDGQKFSDSKPLHFGHGERLRVMLVNDRMMPHPIHLHGMWSELVSPEGKFQVRKHTIMVQPARRITYLVNADPPCNWAYHCHLPYHMEAGMFRKVVVS